MRMLGYSSHSFHSTQTSKFSLKHPFLFSNLYLISLCPHGSATAHVLFPSLLCSFLVVIRSYHIIYTVYLLQFDTLSELFLSSPCECVYAFQNSMFMPSDQSFQHHHYLIPQQPNPMAAIGMATQTTASANCWILPTSSSCCKDPQSAPNCPRCASSNTKFCYYNNYSLAQPRYFCKGCRRYWTKGGSLRNVPIGQGCRKTRRCSRSSSSSIKSRSQGQDSSSESSDGGRSGNKVVEIDVAAVFNQYLNQNINPCSQVPNPFIASSLPSISTASSKLLSETAHQPGDLLQLDDDLLPEECNNIMKQQQQQQGKAANAMDQFWDAGITLPEDTTTLWDNDLYSSSDITPNWLVPVEDLGGLPHLLGDTNYTNNCFDLTSHENDIF